MTDFKLNDSLNKNKIFLVNRSEIEERLDPQFYNPYYYSIFQSKNNWIRLNEVIDCLYHPPEYKRVFSNSGFQLIRSQNVRPIGIDLSETPVFLDKNVVNATKIIYPAINDILIVRSGVNAGDVAIVEKKYSNTIIGADTLLLRVIPKILPKFVQVYFYTDVGRKQLNRYITGATNKHINSHSLKQVYFPVLDESIQNKCIELFECSIKESQNKQSQSKSLLKSIDSYLLDELGIELPKKDDSLKARIFTAKFSSVCGGRLDPLYMVSANILHSRKYSQKKLSDVCSYFSSGFGAGKEDQKNAIDGIIQIRPTNIDENCDLKFDKNIYVDEHQNISKIEKTDVLFNNTNSQELVGKTALGELAEGMYYSNHITVIKTIQSELNPLFLKETLNLLQREKVFFSICTNWNNQSGVGLDLLKTISIPLPPLSKQIEIAEHIKEIRSQAKQLEIESEQILTDAKKEIEKMILGE